MTALRPMSKLGALAPLAGAEARLQAREWAPMLFAFLFPPLMFVVLSGVFGNQPDEAFGGTIPSSTTWRHTSGCRSARSRWSACRWSSRPTGSGTCSGVSTRSESPPRA